MHPKSPKWLDDIANSCAFIAEDTAGASLPGYQHDRTMRQTVERNFEIIGEALLRLEHTDPETAGRISDYRKVIGFRNRLVHNYDDIDNQQVWDIIQRFLPVLKVEVERLLLEEERREAVDDARD